MRSKYPSDISRKEFENILPILETFRKHTKPRQVDLYDVFCAILYLLKSGCQWRMLPKEFPHWRTVYDYFRLWKNKPDVDQPSLLETILTMTVEKHRIADDREAKTSFIIVDSQSVPNADTAEEKGYDAGKKISGIKRHVAVDTQGLPHAIHVTTANITDRTGALETFQHSENRLEQVVHVLVDGAYTGEEFANSVVKLLDATVEVAKRSELHTFKIIPQRWVVERSFGWLDKCRRLWKNCERLLNTSLHMVIFAFISILLRRNLE